MKYMYILYWLLLCSQFCYSQVKDSILFKKIRVQSSSSICLQGESLRMELVVTNPTDDSIAITFRFTNRGNKAMGLDSIYGTYYNKETQKVYFKPSLFSYDLPFDMYYCNVKCIAPGEHYEFTEKVFAPQYKTIYIEFIYIMDIPFLVEKKVLHLGGNRKICYPLEGRPDCLKFYILEFEKNLQEIYLPLPIKGCLCEPTLTPTKD